MRPCDLAGGELVVVGHVGRGVVAAVLELHRESHPELLDVKARRREVDADRFPDRPCSIF
jgi:hypothetical protein